MEVAGPRSALGGNHQSKVTAGTGTQNTEAVGIDSEGRRVVPDETHCASDVENNIWDVEARQRAVHDGKHRVSPAKIRFVVFDATCTIEGSS